jgi:uncharacterized protein
VTGRGRAARQRRLDTAVVETIPAVAVDGGDVAMPLREAFEYYGTARGAVPNYANAFAVESYEQPGVDAQEAAKRLGSRSCSCTPSTPWPPRSPASSTPP